MPVRPLIARLLLAFLCAAAPLVARSSVWKVTRGHSTLFLGGTIHMLRPADFPLPAEFDTAFAASSRLVFETDVARLQSPDMHAAIATHGMFADGTTLDQVLTPTAWKAATAYSAQAGLPLDAMKQMKPWLFTVMMAALELQKLGISNEGVDFHFFQQAADAGKTTGELESFERHIQHLVNLGAGHESEMIIKSIEDLAELPRTLDDLIAAWRAGDTEKIDALMLRDIRKKYPAVFKNLLADRNQAWLPKLEELLTTADVEFVLVGAGHLSGREGLLALLKARGCKLEQIEPAPTPKRLDKNTAAPALPKVLFFANPMTSDNTVIRRPKPDELSIAEQRFAEIARGVFDVTITQDGSEVTRGKLVRYQAVVFFTAINPPGVEVDALVAWVRAGRAFVGIHSTANTFQKIPAFGEMLGANFDRRPWRTAQAPQTKVRINVHDRTHPATRHLGASFEIADDIYQFKNFDATNVQLLLTLDPASLDLSAPKMNRQDRVLPVAWSKPFGAGRVFYTALGDWDETWLDPRYRTHLIQGIQWTLKRAD